MDWTKSYGRNGVGRKVDARATIQQKSFTEEHKAGKHRQFAVSEAYKSIQKISKLYSLIILSKV